ncbi:MAG: winged helix-turn-helix transcriptional regulator [Candidatus Pacearchaeota archaeon]
MENKKLGILLIIISLVVGALLFQYNSQLTERADELGCYPVAEDCIPIERSLSTSHLAIGIFAFILALGFYLLFFNQTEQAILKRLEEEKDEKIKDKKFKYISMALDPYEKKVIKTVKEQEGITQNVLRIKTNMSKSKLSYVLQELEKKNLVKREKKGKTLQVYLKF